MSASKPTSAREPVALRLSALPIGRWLLNTFVALVLVFLVLPSLFVIPMSLGEDPFIAFPPKGLTLKWYREFFSAADWLRATGFSLSIAVGTTVIATVIGTLASIALERGTLPGAKLIETVSLAPLILPHIVLAIGLYLVFAPIGLTGNFAGFVIAHTLLSVPYVVITVTAALRRVDPLLELAALNCGASRSRAFLWVVLPDIAPSVAGGAVFAFLASFDEATVAFFISGVEGKTITRKLFEDIDYNLTPVIAAASTIMMLLAFLLMGSVEWLRRRIGRRRAAE
ncbi:MAG: ABC transporter permease [Hyphomicrobiaceae bacterium]|nr:MAG: ABC transporter permease [Hyphomicrobiaceae bacterium]